MTNFFAAAKNLALVQGNRCGIYSGPTAAVNSIEGLNAGRLSAMVDPKLFGALITMGVTKAHVQSNALTVQTRTGLLAKIPVVIDPLRQTTLNQPVDGVTVSVSSFEKWLKSAQAVSKATSERAYTWRSNVFSYRHNVLASARLDCAWPVFWVVNRKVLETFAGCVDAQEITQVSVSRAELLVSSKTFQAQACAEELPMPEQAIALLAKHKPHCGVVQFQVPMKPLRRAIHQIKALTSAHRAKDVDVLVSSIDGSLHIRSQFLDIEVPGVTLSSRPFRTQSSALMALDAVDGDVLEVIADAGNETDAPLVVRGANMHLLMAVRREEKP